MITAAAIAKALKGHKAGAGFIARCPAHDDRSPSLSLRDTDGKVLVKCHAGCDQSRVISALQRLGLWPESTRVPYRENFNKKNAAEEVQKYTSAEPPVDGEKDRAVARAIELWREARSVVDTPVAAYLASRGLQGAAALQLGHVLRFHPACPFRLEDGSVAHLPTMLGLYRDIRSNEPRAVHRTALRPDGLGKSEHPGLGTAKRMLGPVAGCAIKLTPDAEVTHGLALAEGVETSATALCAGWAPIWTCGSAGGIADFPVLPGIEALTIFADADEAGVKAARACRSRWQEAGRECSIILPPEDGTDWNDAARAA